MCQVNRYMIQLSGTSRFESEQQCSGSIRLTVQVVLMILSAVVGKTGQKRSKQNQYHHAHSSCYLQLAAVFISWYKCIQQSDGTGISQQPLLLLYCCMNRPSSLCHTIYSLILALHFAMWNHFCDHQRCQHGACFLCMNRV